MRLSSCAPPFASWSPFRHGRRFFMDANCLHSALPVAATLGTWEEPGHVVGGIFSRRRRRGNKIGARGVPDSHSLKRHERTRSCHATERSRLEERNTRTSCKRSSANSSFLPLMKRWLISITKLSSARRSRRTAGQKMPHKQPPSHLPYIAGTCEKRHRRRLNRQNP
jgi:hypothetical protein